MYCYIVLLLFRILKIFYLVYVHSCFSFPIPVNKLPEGEGGCALVH